MARPPTEFDPTAMASAIADWRAGVLTQPQISKRYGIPYKTLTRRLAGIARDGVETTRALVSGAMAGVPNPKVDAKVAGAVAKSVALATDAMRDADEVFRLAIKLSREKLSAETAGILSPKDLRDYTSTAKEAMEGVRRVRELDGPADNPLKDLFAQIGASAALRPKADA